MTAGKFWLQCPYCASHFNVVLSGGVNAEFVTVCCHCGGICGLDERGSLVIIKEPRCQKADMAAARRTRTRIRRLKGLSSEVEAALFTGDPPHPDDVYIGEHGAMLNTPQGPMAIFRGDWIVTGPSGEKYSCKPSAFVLVYKAMQYAARARSLIAFLLEKPSALL